jgi:hypothetical protein
MAALKMYERSFTGPRGTRQLQKYFDFHDFTFFSFKQMRENERVRQSAKDKRNLPITWCTINTYNDWCIIKLLLSDLFRYFLTLKQKF